LVSKEELAKLASQVVGILAAIIILAIVQAVAVRLPVMGIAVYRHISLAAIISAGFFVIIIILVLSADREIAQWAVEVFPTFPEAVTFINNIAALAVILIAYNAFDDLIVPFLYVSGVTWLYPLLLLGAIAFPVYQIITTLLNSSAKITALTTGGKAPSGAATTVACPHCGGIVSQARFCGLCGKEMIIEPVLQTCSNCGAALRPDAKFCTTCGKGVVGSGGRSQHRQARLR